MLSSVRFWLYCQFCLLVLFAVILCSSVLWMVNLLLIIQKCNMQPEFYKRKEVNTQYYKCTINSHTSYWLWHVLLNCLLFVLLARIAALSRDNDRLSIELHTVNEILERLRDDITSMKDLRSLRNKYQEFIESTKPITERKMVEQEYAKQTRQFNYTISHLTEKVKCNISTFSNWFLLWFLCVDEFSFLIACLVFVLLAFIEWCSFCFFSLSLFTRLW